MWYLGRERMRTGDAMQYKCRSAADLESRLPYSCNISPALLLLSAFVIPRPKAKRG